MPVPVEDLISDGLFGLIDAVDKYDPSRGVQFEAYAVNRIRGAIIDGVRAMDWVPRSVRSKGQRITAATETLAHTLHRQPSDEEVAAYTGMSERDVVLNFNERYVRTFDKQDQYGGVIDDQRHDLSQSTEQTTELDALRTTIATQLEQFTEREQWLFALYYFEGLTLAEIGVVLGVTEARVCQIHTKAMEDLCAGVTPR